MASALLIATVWCLLFIQYLGFGLAIRIFLGEKKDNLSLTALFQTAWLGWAGSLSALQIWHLFFPINELTFFIFSCLGSIAFLCNYSKNSVNADSLPSRRKLYWASSIVIVLWFANHAVHGPFNYDSGVYHINSVRWINSYAVVPGLGNLHGRLAFNISYFLYVAFLEIKSWASRSYHLANGFLLSLFCLQSAASIFKVLFSRFKIRPSDLLWAMFFSRVCY